MRQSLMILWAGLAAMLAAVPAQAQTMPDRDLHCAAVVFYMYATDPDHSPAGKQAMMYFLGSVQSRMSKAELAAQFPVEVQKLGAPTDSDLKECGEMFGQNSDDFAAIVQTLPPLAGTAPAKP